MTTPSGPAAHDATVADVLSLLDSEFAAFAQGVAQARYTLWVGSGISLGRVDGLKTILLKAVQRLQLRADPTDPDCRFIGALKKFAQLSGVSDSRLSVINLATDPLSWPESIRADFLSGLAANYSKVMQVRVDGEPEPDFLLWHIIDVRDAYASGILKPDCEHIAMAILGLERVAPQILSANWDGLIEKGFEKLGHPHDLLVCAAPEDLSRPAQATRLVKFHGCAIRAAGDEAHYRPLLIHQAVQIAGYATNSDYAGIRTELVSQAITHPTLMIGLSAQDPDIQFVFAQAAAAHSWPFPSNPPAFVCAENSLGADQGTVLGTIYGPAFHPNANEIEKSSVIRAFAKPLLASLTLHILFQKLTALAKRCSAPNLGVDEIASVADGLLALRDRLGTQADGRHLAWIIRLARWVTAMMQILRTGVIQSGTAYWPLTKNDVSQIATDPEIQFGGLPEFALALAILGSGVADGTWEMRPGPQPGMLEVVTVGTGRVSRVVFSGSGRSAVALERSGMFDPTAPDAVVVHSDGAPVPLSRSPRTSPGRTGATAPRHVSIFDLLEEAATPERLRDRFREEAGL